MEKLYVDAGTTWTKILKVNNKKKDYSVILTSEFRKLNLKYNKSTGHSLEKKEGVYENEIVALAYGAKKYLKNNLIILDLGSRDIKYAEFQNKKFKDMDWNTTCASATGATVEMLLKFYNIKPDELKYTDEKYSITCGIFGMEKIMDDIAKGEKANIAIAKFIHGIAFNAYNFAKKPNELYVSGGFCENKCFLDSLSHYCKVIPVGRYALVDGLYSMDNP